MAKQIILYDRATKHDEYFKLMFYWKKWTELSISKVYTSES